MILAVDVHYDPSGDWARTGAVVFTNWGDKQSFLERVDITQECAVYRSGHFYERELPCILPMIEEFRKAEDLTTVVVDGFVDLAGGQAGLGRHLFQGLGAAVEIVGVAKNSFKDAPAVEVPRGQSRKPLWISSTGNVDQAAERVRSMSGDSRIPTLLKRADSVARGTVRPLPG